MNSQASPRKPGSRWAAATAVLCALAVMATSCATSSVSPGAMVSALTDMPLTPPTPDPRVGLGAGLTDAEEAAWNMRLVSTTLPPDEFVGVTTTDSRP